MKRILSILILLVAAFAVYWFFFRSKSSGDRGPRQEALKVKKHSSTFTDTVNTILTAYFDLKTAFVDADTLKIKLNCDSMVKRAEHFTLAELKKDTVGIYDAALAQIGDVIANAKSLLLQTDITEMRKDFSMVNENLYPFLKTIKYDSKPLYWQSDPNAFGEGKVASWVSNTIDVINPYKGKAHPEFKDAQLNTGEIRDTIK